MLLGYWVNIARSPGKGDKVLILCMPRDLKVLIISSGLGFWYGGNIDFAVYGGALLNFFSDSRVFFI